VVGCLHDRANIQQTSSKRQANIEQTSSWLKQACWNPARGSNVGLGLAFSLQLITCYMSLLITTRPPS